MRLSSKSTTTIKSPGLIKDHFFECSLVWVFFPLKSTTPVCSSRYPRPVYELSEGLSAIAGYQGKSCMRCQDGWTEMDDGTCMKIVNSLRIEANAVNFSNINVTMPPGPWNDNITMTKGAAAAGILGTAVTISTLIGIFCCVKHCCCTERKSTVPATSPAATLPRNCLPNHVSFNQLKPSTLSPQ